MNIKQIKVQIVYKVSNSETKAKLIWINNERQKLTKLIEIFLDFIQLSLHFLELSLSANIKKKQINQTRPLFGKSKKKLDIFIEMGNFSL